MQCRCAYEEDAWYPLVMQITEDGCAHLTKRHSRQDSSSCTHVQVLEPGCALPHDKRDAEFRRWSQTNVFRVFGRVFFVLLGGSSFSFELSDRPDAFAAGSPTISDDIGLSWAGGNVCCLACQVSLKLHPQGCYAASAGSVVPHLSLVLCHSAAAN